MTCIVSWALNLLLTAQKNFDMARDQRSAAAESKYKGKDTNYDIIFTKIVHHFSQTIFQKQPSEWIYSESYI